MTANQPSHSKRHNVMGAHTNCITSFIALVIVLTFVETASTQTIANSDRTRFVAKFARTDTVNWLHSVDYSRIVEWRLDTVEGRRAVGAPEYINTPLKYLWTALDNDRFPSMPDYFPSHPTASMVRQDIGVAFHFLYNWGSEFVLLSVWDLVGIDSIRYRCAFPTEFFWPNDALWIEKVARFPDSSLLIFLHSTNVMDAEDGDNDWFYRWRQPCEFQLLHETAWEVKRQALFQRITYDIQALSDTCYRVFENSDFGRIVGDPYGHSMSRDSSTTQEIDLWGLAVKMFGLDTTRAK